MGSFSSFFQLEQGLIATTTDDNRAKQNRLSVALSANAAYNSIVASGVNVTNKVAALKQELADAGYTELSESLS